MYIEIFGYLDGNGSNNLESFTIKMFYVGICQTHTKFSSPSKMDQPSKITQNLCDSTEILEIRKPHQEKTKLRKVKSVESGLGSLHEGPESGFEFTRWSKMTNVSSSNDSYGFGSSVRSSSDSVIADKDDEYGDIRIYDITEELEHQFNEVEITQDSNLGEQPAPRRPTPFFDEEDIYQPPSKRFKSPARLSHQIIHEDKVFDDMEELSEGEQDENCDEVEELGSGTNRRPTPYPANEQSEIPERRSNTPSLRKLSSQRLSDACSLLDEAIAEVEDEILIFEKSLASSLSAPSLD